MNVEFEYFLDEKTGEATLSFSKGIFNDAQQNALINEIGKQQARLMLDKSGYFRPQSPVLGLPEDIAFKYSYKQVSPSSRSVIFNMFWEGTIPESSLEKKETIQHHPTDDFHSKIREDIEELQQQKWVTLYIDLLTQRLNSLSYDPSDKAEKVSLDYTVTELQQFLKDNNENNTLLLFSAYLHFAVTHFWQIDREKASLFLLAARSIEAEMDTKSQTQANKNLLMTDDSFDKSRSTFAKIFQQFFPTKA